SGRGLSVRVGNEELNDQSQSIMSMVCNSPSETDLHASCREEMDSDSGGGGIRTHGTAMRYTGFRDRPFQPLRHPSDGVSSNEARNDAPERSRSVFRYIPPRGPRKSSRLDDSSAGRLESGRVYHKPPPSGPCSRRPLVSTLPARSRRRTSG